MIRLLTKKPPRTQPRTSPRAWLCYVIANFHVTQALSAVYISVRQKRAWLMRGRSWLSEDHTGFSCMRCHLMNNTSQTSKKKLILNQYLEIGGRLQPNIKAKLVKSMRPYYFIRKTCLNFTWEMSQPIVNIKIEI